MALLHTADPGVNLSLLTLANCNDNPAFLGNEPNNEYLNVIAPPPPSCDMAGQGPCATESTIPTVKPLRVLHR